MKKILYRIIFVFMAVGIIACERDLPTANVATGEIAFPSIVVLGGDPIVQVASGTFDDPGAQAFLGVDDITDQMDIDNPVDPAVADVYIVTYSVATTNVLGAESQASATRTVMITSEDVSGIDLSGNYVRNGDPSSFPVVLSTRVGEGIYLFPNAFGSGTVINGFQYYHTGGDQIVAPIQNSQFGRLSGSGTLTADGFQYSLAFLDPPNVGVVLNRTFVKQ